MWRKLHLKITESMDVHAMPDDFTRLTWVLLPLWLDREGRAINNATLCRAKLYPLRDDVTTAMVRAALDWFLTRRMILEYEVGDMHYFYSPTWKLYQGWRGHEPKSTYPGPGGYEEETQAQVKPEPPPEALTPLQEAMCAQVRQRFLEFTKLEEPEPSNERERKIAEARWDKPITHICRLAGWEQARAEGWVAGAVQLAVAKELNLSAPCSIERIIENLAAAEARGNGNGHGGRPSKSEAEYDPETGGYKTVTR